MTKSEDKEVNDTQSCYQFFKTITTSKKQFSHRLCVFVKKKQKTKNTCISARCVITVRLHATYWEITQAWHKPFTFDNFAIVLISLDRMTVSFLLLLSLMLCMLFQTFFSLSFMAWHSGTFAILFPSSIMSSFFFPRRWFL